MRPLPTVAKIHPGFVVVGLSLLLRAPALVMTLAPPGHDITLLADLVRLYLDAWAQGLFLPESWQSLFGASELLEFHSLLAIPVAAVVWLLPGSMLLCLKAISVIGFVVYDGGVFWLLWTLSKKSTQENKFALWFAWILVCFVAPVPQRFWGSGGGAFVFALGLMLISVTMLLTAWKRNERGWIWAMVGGVLLFVSLLTHPIPGVFVPFFVGACLLGDEASAHSLRNSFWRMLTKALCYAGPVLPALLFFRPQSAHVHQLVAQWLHVVRDTYSALGPFEAWTNVRFDGVSWDVMRFPFFWVKQFGIVFVFTGGAWLLYRPHRSACLGMLATVAMGLVVWFGSYIPYIGLALYPDRGSPLLAVLLGFVCLQILNGTRRKFAYEQMGVGVLIAALALTAFARYSWSYLWQPRGLALMRSDDLSVIQQVPLKVPKSEWIDTSYYDAGVWIPGLVGYKITQPHVHFALDAAWLTERRLQAKPRYAFVGTFCAADSVCNVRCTPRDIVVAQSGAAHLCKKMD